jgi:hypothetical protein
MPVIRAHGSSKPCRSRILATVHRPHSSRCPRVRSPHGCLTCPSVRAVRMLRRPGSPATRQPAFAAGHQARYPASYTSATRRRSRSYCRRFPAALSAAGIRFLGALFPPRNSAFLAVGLPHRHYGVDLTEFPRSTRVRPDRVGCHLYPGSSGVHTTVDECSVAACRFSAARSLSSPPSRPDAGSCRNEASAMVHWHSPFRSSPHL